LAPRAISIPAAPVRRISNLKPTHRSISRKSPNHSQENFKVAVPLRGTANLKFSCRLLGEFKFLEIDFIDSGWRFCAPAQWQWRSLAVPTWRFSGDFGAAKYAAICTSQSAAKHFNMMLLWLA
jgi:hypothetical protein